jgi:hypothetical protein
VLGEAHFYEPVGGAIEPSFPIHVVKAPVILVWHPIFFELLRSWPVEQSIEVPREVLVDVLGLILYLQYNIPWIIPLDITLGQFLFEFLHIYNPAF